MSDYQPVAKALAEGAEPAMLCQTCPWDRHCVNPPTMTAGEVEQQIKQAAETDRLAALAGDPGSQRMPVNTLVALTAYAGQDTAMQACPVLALRLRSSDGRKLADQVRGLMQSWVES